MSRVCEVTGKKPMAGNNVSHEKQDKKRFCPIYRFIDFGLKPKTDGYL